LYRLSCIRHDEKPLTSNLVGQEICKFRKFLYGLGYKRIQVRKFCHGRQEGLESKGLDLVSWVCQTFEIQVLKTHVSTQERCQEGFQQCLGEWCGRWSGLELEDLGSLSRQRRSCTRTWPCGWGRSFEYKDRDAFCLIHYLPYTVETTIENWRTRVPTDVP